LTQMGIVQSGLAKKFYDKTSEEFSMETFVSSIKNEDNRTREEDQTPNS